MLQLILAGEDLPGRGFLLVLRFVSCRLGCLAKLSIDRDCEKMLRDQIKDLAYPSVSQNDFLAQIFCLIYSLGPL